MNILAPVNTAEEISILSHEGASEFYCGYLPEMWRSEYQESIESQDMHISINKRESYADNILTLDEMNRIISESDKYRAKLFVTLNRLNYPESSYRVLKSCINELVEIGVKCFIVTDIGLIEWLHNYYPDIKLVLSTCGMSLNCWSHQLYREMGIQRITLPRHVAVNEVVHMCKTMYFINIIDLRIKESY